MADDVAERATAPANADVRIAGKRAGYPLW
jgi:hypothetical protein